MSTARHKAPPPSDGIDPLDTFWHRLLEIHQDPRRAYPRVQVTLPVQLEVDTQVVHGRTHDIGRGGFQLRCDQGTAARIAPKRRTASEERTAHLRLAIGERVRSIETRCRIAHVSLLPSDDDAQSPGVALGFSFTAIGERERQSLEQFIVAHLEPAPTP